MAALTHAPTVRRERARSLGNTAIGVLILAVMLFPVYWMINVSLQSSGSAVGTPWIPLNVTFRGYSTAISLDFSRV